MLKSIIGLTLIFLCQVLYGQQNYTYRGLIFDAHTMSGVEGVHIITNDSRVGVVSNSEGAFILKSARKIKTLVFSHVSYETLSYEIIDKSNSELKILLNPSIQTLQQVTVSGLLPKQVILKAIENIEENHTIEPVYYQFFTRVINFSKDSVLNFLEEHVGYIYQKPNHNSSFGLEKSRFGSFSKYGDKQFETHRLISMSEMYTDNMGKYLEDFLHKKRFKFYTYEFDEDAELMGRECYVLLFNTYKDTYYKKGKLYIDKEDYGILRKTLNNDDYKEVTFRRINDKYYLNSTFYIKPRGNYYIVRNTIYNNSEEPSSLKFLDKGKLSPEYAKKVADDFNDTYWDHYNFIPLPNWIENEIKGKIR